MSKPSSSSMATYSTIIQLLGWLNLYKYVELHFQMIGWVEGLLNKHFNFYGEAIHE